MLGALTALLPLLESVGGSIAGSTAAATGAASVGATTAAAAGTAASGSAAGATAGLSSGFGSLVGRMMGTVEGFANSEQLGHGVQKAQQLADAIAAMKQSISGSHDRQAELIANAKGRPGEVDPYTGARGADTPDTSNSPEHLQALADLQSQRAAMERDSKAKNAELVDLHARIGQTTNPRSPLETLGKVGSLAAGGGAISSLMGMLGGGGGDGGHADGNLASTLVGAPQKALGPLGSILGKIASFIPGASAPGNMAQAGLQPFTDLGVNRAEGNVIGGATNYFSEGMGKAMNPMSVVNGELAVHAAKLPGLLQEWGEGLVESRRHLMQFNGTLAQSFLEAERRGLIRDVQSGERTSGATAGLSDALQDLADSVAPLKDAVVIVVSRGVESLVRGVTLGVEIMKGIYEGVKLLDFTGQMKTLEKFLEAAGKGGPAQNNIRDFIADVKGRDPSIPRRIPRR